MNTSAILRKAGFSSPSEVAATAMRFAATGKRLNVRIPTTPISAPCTDFIRPSSSRRWMEAMKAETYSRRGGISL